MAEEVGVVELRLNLSELLGRVQYGGATIDVTRAGRLAAHLVPPGATVTSGATDAAPEAGGHPVRLAHAAAEAVRAANHATFSRTPMPGLASAANAYDLVGELQTLAMRLPQLCEQLAAVLTNAVTEGELTGVPDQATRAAGLLGAAGVAFHGAFTPLEEAHNALGGIGGWLGKDADRLGADDEDLDD